MTTTKTCKDCGITLPVAEFPPHGRGPGARCRPCHREWKRNRFPEGHRTLPQRAGEVDAGPFVAWARAFVVRAGSEGEAATRMGVQPRQLYRWVNRPMRFIGETTIDKVFCEVGEPYLLREMYPELYEDLAA